MLGIIYAYRCRFQWSINSKIFTNLRLMKYISQNKLGSTSTIFQNKFFRVMYSLFMNANGHYIQTCLVTLSHINRWSREAQRISWWQELPTGGRNVKNGSFHHQGAETTKVLSLLNVETVTWGKTKRTGMAVFIFFSSSFLKANCLHFLRLRETWMFVILLLHHFVIL